MVPQTGAQRVFLTGFPFYDNVVERPDLETRHFLILILSLCGCVA